MNIKLLIITIIIVLVIVIAGWYLYSYFVQQPQQGYNIEPSVTPSLDTTTNISNELNQVPDDSSVDGVMNSLDKDLECF